MLVHHFMCAWMHVTFVGKTNLGVAFFSSFSLLSGSLSFPISHCFIIHGWALIIGGASPGKISLLPSKTALAHWRSVAEVQQRMVTCMDSYEQLMSAIFLSMNGAGLQSRISRHMVDCCSNTPRNPCGVVMGILLSASSFLRPCASCIKSDTPSKINSKILTITLSVRVVFI